MFELFFQLVVQVKLFFVNAFLFLDPGLYTLNGVKQIYIEGQGILAKWQLNEDC